jgi:hypothetical protein
MYFNSDTIILCGYNPGIKSEWAKGRSDDDFQKKQALFSLPLLALLMVLGLHFFRIQFQVDVRNDLIQTKIAVVKMFTAAIRF